MNDSIVMKEVRKTLRDAQLLRADATLLIGVSGGADSVALLMALLDIRKECSFAIHACYIQHGLRGESTYEDERFVKQLCEGRAVPLSIIPACLAGGIADAGAETRARERRREIFAEQMDLLHADALLVAHHRDDQVETVLMHLLRGAGGEGLSGMRKCTAFARGVMLRPLLDLPKHALLQLLAQLGIGHREDESNQETITPRNALRIEILPQLEQLFPETGKHIAQAAQSLAVDEQYMKEQTDRLYREVLVHAPPLFSLRKEGLIDAPQALQSRVLRKWFAQGVTVAGLTPSERSLSFGDTMKLLALTVQKAGSIENLPHGLCAVAGGRHIHLRKQGGDAILPMPEYKKVALDVSRAVCEFAGLCIAIIPPTPSDKLPTDANSVIISADMLRKELVFRLPRADDLIHPLGASGSKPLRRYFTDRKIDLAFRPLIPVLAVGSQVLWVLGLCTAEELRAVQITKESIRLSIIGGNDII